jgi:hypothetical protein
MFYTTAVRNMNKKPAKFAVCKVVTGARGGVVVKALRYKPAGHRFDFRWCHWNFLVT